MTLWLPVTAAGVAVVPCSLTAQVLALLVGHHREVEVDARDALERQQRGGRRGVWISLRSGHPATVRATSTDVDAVGPRLGAAHHAEVDDRAVQLGVLDRAQRVDELLGRDGHGWGARCSGRISTVPIGRIPVMIASGSGRVALSR